jgi:hypothetical protein
MKGCHVQGLPAGSVHLAYVIGLQALCVANEHPRSTLVIEFANVAKLLGERKATEDP